MCGIVGVLSSRPIEPGAVADMRDRLVHRGPDDSGLWLSEDRHVALGFRRLAIIDLSRDANQPFASADGRFHIVFNGEIYNFKDLRGVLESDGIVFRTRSDTEVLIESFRRWGGACLDRLSGMFAFAIWDRVERRLFCARDRVGEKPFYYAQLPHAFIFGSELKALLAWPELSRRMHFPALVDFLSFGFVADPKCIWEDCRKLPPGHSVWIDMRDGATPAVRKPTRYWDFTFNPDESVADWGPHVRGALEAASAEMSYADVPVGAFLSGGIDSSAVVAALSRTGSSVRTFTIGFDDRAYDERPYARQIAELHGTAHHERLVVADDVATQFSKLVWHFDEPFNDYSYFPTFYVCRTARESITVALSGDGGDELFAGYTKYRRLGLREDLRSLLPSAITRAVLRAAAAGFEATSPLRRTLLQHGMDGADMFTDMFTLGFPPVMLERAARGELAACLAHYSPRDTITELLTHAPPDEVGVTNAMRYLDLKLTLAGDILVKVDRASMAVSLEVRPVFLNRHVLEVASRIPPRLLASRHDAKSVLKAAMRPWLPAAILDRPKMGFAMPLKSWIAGGIRSLETTAPAGVSADWLDPSLLTELVAAHQAGRADLTPHIHSLSFLREWCAQWSGALAGQRA